MPCPNTAGRIWALFSSFTTWCPIFPWYYYPVMYGLILMMYLLISLLLMRNIRKITPAEVLKNRE